MITDSNEVKVLGKVFNFAADLLENGWTRGKIARDKFGRCVSASSDSAIVFCALGALQRVCLYTNDACSNEIFDSFNNRYIVYNMAYLILQNYVINETDFECVTDWQDDEKTMKSEIILVFRTIAKERS